MPQSAITKFALVQPVDNSIDATALVIGQLTELGHSIENEIGDEKTKFGRIVSYGQNSESVDVSFYLEKGDEGQSAVYRAIKEKKQIKIWMVDTEVNAAGKYDVRFGYALVESYEESSETEGFIEVSSTLQILGETVDGEFDTLPNSLVLQVSALSFEKPGEYTGELAKRNKGEYKASAKYEVGDIVTHNKKRYRAIKKIASATTAPNSDSENWEVL